MASRTELWAAISWATVATIAGAAVAPLEPSVLEEGLILHVAQRMIDGERLYTDVSFFTGPFPFQLLAGFFRVFGEHLFVARGILVALQALATGLIFTSVRRSVGPASAHLVAAIVAFAPIFLFPFFTFYFYSSICYYLAVTAIFAVDPDRLSGYGAFIAGATIAFVALSKQNLGLILALSLISAAGLCAMPGRRFRHCLAIVSGGATVTAFTLVYFAARGSLGDLIDELVFVPLSLGSSFESPFPNLWPLGEFGEGIRKNTTMYVPSLYLMLTEGAIPRAIIGGTQILYALPLAALAATALLRARGPLPSIVWMHAALLVTMTANMFPRTDWGHLVYAMPAAGVHLVLLAASMREPSQERAIGQVAALSGVGILLAAALVLVGQLYEKSIAPNLGERVPLRPVSAFYQRDGLSRVIEYLSRHTESGEDIFVARQEPLVYFATGTHNPTPHLGLVPGLREEQEDAILSVLPSLRYVVFSEIDQPHFGFYGDELPNVMDYLERHYRIPDDFDVDQNSWLLVLENGEDRGRTEIDLLRAASTTERFLRNLDNQITPDDEALPRMRPRLLHRPVPIRLGVRGGGIDYTFTVPENAELQMGLGLRYLRSTFRRHEHPANLLVGVSAIDESGVTRLRRVQILTSRTSGASWSDLKVPLDDFAGRTVKLRIEFLSRRPLNDGVLAWLGSPRIAVDDHED
jgi:hypothetical protein